MKGLVFQKVGKLEVNRCERRLVVDVEKKIE